MFWSVPSARNQNFCLDLSPILLSPSHANFFQISGSFLETHETIGLAGREGGRKHHQFDLCCKGQILYLTLKF